MRNNLEVWGQPGAYSAQLAKRSKLCATGWAVAGLGAAVCAVGAWFDLGWVASLVCVVAVVVAWRKTSGHNRRAGQARIGAESEQRVVRMLVQSGLSGRVWCGLLLGGGGDVDLVVASGATLAAVEIKTGFGPVSISGTHIRAGRRIIPGDPVGQVKRQKAALSRHSGRSRVTAIVCVSNGTVPGVFAQVGDVYVTEAVHLGWLIAHLGGGQAVTSVGDLATLAEKQHKRRLRTV